ncbi:VanZ family protein [Streptomyces sp. enrichment culture]|uniref:VanZ family protein n=1 Tax=Streptomyces sp. enrichment culture TaxID=1795815 RepID=UPI003F57293E
MPLWQTIFLVTPVRTVVVLLVAPFVVAVFLALSARRAEAMRVAGLIGLTLYVLLVLVATFSLNRSEGGSGGLSLGSLGYLMSGGENLGSMEKDMIVRQSLANVLMFVPFPALIRLSWPRAGLWTALGSCVLLTFLIEMCQFLVGGGRVADVEDFLLNSLGGGVGLLVLVVAQAVCRVVGGGAGAGARRKREKRVTAGQRT